MIFKVIIGVRMQYIDWKRLIIIGIIIITNSLNRVIKENGGWFRKII